MAARVLLYALNKYFPVWRGYLVPVSVIEITLDQSLPALGPGDLTTLYDHLTLQPAPDVFFFNLYQVIIVVFFRFRLSSAFNYSFYHYPVYLPSLDDHRDYITPVTPVVMLNPVPMKIGIVSASHQAHQPQDSEINSE